MPLKPLQNTPLRLNRFVFYSADNDLIDYRMPVVCEMCEKTLFHMTGKPRQFRGYEVHHTMPSLLRAGLCRVPGFEVRVSAGSTPRNLTH